MRHEKQHGFIHSILALFINKETKCSQGHLYIVSPLDIILYCTPQYHSTIEISLQKLTTCDDPLHQFQSPSRQDLFFHCHREPLIIMNDVGMFLSPSLFGYHVWILHLFHKFSIKVIFL
jgi:hypothetical protein